MSGSVLAVTNAYPDFPGSYHGIFVKRIAEKVSCMGWHTHVLVPRIYSDSLEQENLETHDVTRFRFPSAGKLLIEYERPPVIRIGCLIASGVRSAVRTIRAHDCRAVHAHWAFPSGIIAAVAAKLTSRPMLLTVHGSDWRLAAERGGLFRKTFLWTARRSQWIISVNQQISDWMVEAGIPQSKILLQPVGADTELFNCGQPPADRTPFSVISVRNLNELYHVGDLIEAASLAHERLTELQLTIAGDGPLREELEVLAERLGLEENVEFVGRLDQGELAGKLGGTSAYVSTSPVEGTSVSLLEAMASGCVPVVTDIPANRDWVVHGRNGLLFEPGDIEALADCLVEAFGNEAIIQAAAECSPKQVVNQGSLNSHVELTARLYSELTE